MLWATRFICDSTTCAGGTPASPGATPTEGQKGRKPSYFARPQIRAAPQPAAPAEAAGAGPGGMTNGNSLAAAAAPAAEAAAGAAKKELPPLLRARLAKRGILVGCLGTDEPKIN